MSGIIDFLMKLMPSTLLVCAMVIPSGAFSQRDFSDSEVTNLVLLGTGNPNPSPDQSGCALALVVTDVPYVVDLGPDVMLTPSGLGRDAPLEVFGPAGIKEMTEHILEPYREDISTGYMVQNQPTIVDGG